MVEISTTPITNLIAKPILTLKIENLENKLLLEIASVSSESSQSKLLIEIAPKLSKEGVQRALTIACSIENIVHKLKCLMALTILAIDEGETKENVKKLIQKEIINLLKSNNSIKAKEDVLCSFPVSLVLESKENNTKNVEEIVELIKTEIPLIRQAVFLTQILDLDVLPKEVIVREQLALIEEIKSIAGLGERYRTLLVLLESGCLSQELANRCSQVALDTLKEMMDDDFILDEKWLEGLYRWEWFTQQYRVLLFLDKKVAMAFECIFYDQIKDGKISSKRFEGTIEQAIRCQIYDLASLLPYVRSESVKEDIHQNIYAATSLLCCFGDEITDVQYIDLLEILLKAKLRNPKLEDSLVKAIKFPKYRSLALETLAEAEKANAPDIARKLARRALKARKDVQPADTNQMATIFFYSKLLKYLSGTQTKRLTSSIFKEIVEIVRNQNDFTIDGIHKANALIAIIPYLSKPLRKKLMEVVEEPDLEFDKAYIYANLLAYVEDKEKENLINLCCDLFNKIGGKSDLNRYRLIKGLIDDGL